MKSSEYTRGEQVLAFITAGDVHGDLRKAKKYRYFLYWLFVLGLLLVILWL